MGGELFLRGERDRKTADEGAAPVRERASEGGSGARRYRCRACGVLLAHAADEISIGGGTRHERVNPAGLVCRFVTLRRCASVQGVGGLVSDFTWFAGYAWQIVVCASCATHLGWRYGATDGGTPASFYGLLLDKLLEERDSHPD
jgi:hypothetical protein